MCKKISLLFIVGIINLRSHMEAGFFPPALMIFGSWAGIFFGQNLGSPPRVNL